MNREIPASPEAAGHVDETDVLAAYRRYAPLYDAVFGSVTGPGRRAAAARINRLSGRVLEAGVGTGLSLPLYKSDLRVTGIDFSPEMLDKARRRVAAERLDHVEALLEMDAGALRFDDASFDALVACYMLTVVPDPAAVLNEFERVLKPGGSLILVNHFRAAGGPRAAVENLLSRFSGTLGWRPDFPFEAVTGRPALDIVEHGKLPPLALFTLLHFRRK